MEYMDETTLAHKHTSPWLIAFRIIFTIALVWCILFIFHNSLETSSISSARSHEVMQKINAILAHLNIGPLSEHVVRKLAHFSEFTLEGFVLSFSASSTRTRRTLILEPEVLEITAFVVITSPGTISLSAKRFPSALRFSFLSLAFQLAVRAVPALLYSCANATLAIEHIVIAAAISNAAIFFTPCFTIVLHSFLSQRF